MSIELLLLALFMGVGVGCLLLALRSLGTAVRLWARGLRVMGVATARTSSDPRRGPLIAYTDHLGRVFVLDPGGRGPLRHLPAVGEKVPVVYLRNRPTAASVWTSQHLLAPSLGWFLSSTLAFGTGLIL
ncbi:hypothetical protein [Streptomyces sp. 049-1]|uniref:hypothetical protein n=1 Tax=Streptomyces sp. 049-1 TaxID=2789264 RepID=UPI00398032E2